MFVGKWENVLKECQLSMLKNKYGGKKDPMLFPNELDPVSYLVTSNKSSDRKANFCISR